MHIAVIGTGYVGLVTGTCLAEFGVEVTCVDKDKDKIDRLLEGEIPIYEPGLEELVKKNIHDGRLHFTTDIREGVERALGIFIAVGTPPRGDGSADLVYVEQVAREIGGCMDGYKVIVTKSTVPVGTGEKIRKILSEYLPEDMFDVASNPEFLREGSAVEDFMRPDRVVIGTESEQARAILRDLYRPLYLIETPFVFTNVATAELIKYASNAFLATKISFINEMANVCEKIGGDVHVVAKAMGLDGRIGPKFLRAGPGYGGSCFPKDTLALVNISRELGEPSRIVESVVAVNDDQKRRAYRKVREMLGDDVKGRTVALLGLAFKPNTDDFRESPAEVIVREVLAEGGTVRAFDPAAMEQARKILGSEGITYCRNAYDAVESADVMVIVTEWNQFRLLDLEKCLKLLKSPCMVDLRNVYEPKAIRALGFSYSSIGRV
ncbi:MAG: UDP-glucose/GDP-mannose dehydrogenase family protein [bacterium]|nr:UDP-glucose/GDP-mannose dehydrogenase family protein [bacterium]MDT8396953.1 UDP-glucose/GDP-mannose dehydrogenase family protein [bacterium]